MIDHTGVNASDFNKSKEFYSRTLSAIGYSLLVELPASVILEVTYTEPGVKGNTATNATKPATVETGAIINVPLFINEGDKIKVETTKGAYQERIKE